MYVDRPYVMNSYSTIAEEEMQCEDSVTALRYWSDRLFGRIAPRWSDIDLLDFSSDLIPRMIVVDCLPAENDFRYRFFGTWQVAGHQMDMTGKHISDFEMNGYGEGVREQYERVIREQRPFVYQLNMVLRNVPYQTEILRLPVSHDGLEIDKVWSIETPIEMVKTA